MFYDDSLYGTGLPGDPLLGEAGGFATTQGQTLPNGTGDTGYAGPAPPPGYEDYTKGGPVRHTDDLVRNNPQAGSQGGVSGSPPPGTTRGGPGAPLNGKIVVKDQYEAGILGIKNNLQQEEFIRNQQLNPYINATNQSYNQGQATRAGILDQQQGVLSGFSQAQGDLYGGWAAKNNGYDQAGNQSVNNLATRFGQSQAMDAENVGQLRGETSRANFMDTQNVGELGGELSRANSMDASNVGELRGLNSQMRQLQAGGYGADVTSDPLDVARQEAAYGTFGNFANGAYDYDSQAAQAYADPEALAAQKEVMGTLREQMDPRLTDQERYLYMQSRLQQEQSNRGNRDANLRELERSGMSGSTMALSNLNASSQENATTRAVQDLGASAKAIDRATTATRDYGNMSNVVADQSFKQAYGRGQAADTASQFNTQTRMQGAVAQGNMATDMRSANDALGMFNKSQSLQQQRFQDSYAADQQAQAWQRGTDISDAGFRQSENVSRNAAIKSDAGFRQSENISRNAGLVSDAGFRQTGNLNQNAATQSDAELRNIAGQRQGTADLTQFGGQANRDWLTGSQNIGQMGMQATRDNQSALRDSTDAAFRKEEFTDRNNTQRNALDAKSVDSRAEDERARRAAESASSLAKWQTQENNKPHNLLDLIGL